MARGHIRRWWWLAALVVAAGLFPAAANAQSPEVALTIFWLDTCPHCAAEHAFLDELQDEYPSLVVEDVEVDTPAGRERFLEAGRTYGFEPQGVPTTILDGRVWIGFSDQVAREIRATVASLAAPTAGPEAPTPTDGTRTDGSSPVDAEKVVDVPIFGEVDVGDRSLLASTVLIAAVDGLNPCSLWALTVLLALVLRTRSRGRVLAVGVTFLAVTAAMYGLYIVGIFSVLAYLTYLVWITRGVGALATALGVVNLKDYLRPGVGPTLSMRAGRRRRVYRRARGLAEAERPLAGALAATAALAVGVSLAETPCTAGLPLLWTSLLASAGTGWTEAAGLFTVYMAVFLVDELLVFGAAVVTMRAIGLQERHGRVLKLLAGSMMATLGISMVVDPTLLTSLRGVLAVLVSTLLVAVAVVGVGRVLGPPTRPERVRGPRSAARA